jgi:hypothetical protein
MTSGGSGVGPPPWHYDADIPYAWTNGNRLVEYGYHGQER